MDLSTKTIDELKVIIFDIEQVIKVNQRDLEVVYNVLNTKLKEEQEKKAVKLTPKEPSKK